MIATEQAVAAHRANSPLLSYSEQVIESAIMPARHGRARWVWLLLAILLASVLVFILGSLAWQLSFGGPGHTDFYLHQSKYKNIVARVKGLPLAAGAQTSTHIDGLLVNAARDASGSYTVTITTVDRNHAGVYGYVFSDLPLIPHSNPNYPDFLIVDNPGEMPFSDERIVGQGGHWWSVYNNLR
jgi:hypothetical protein